MSDVAALPFSAWPTGRKVAAGVFAVGGYVALAGAAGQGRACPKGHVRGAA